MLLHWFSLKILLRSILPTWSSLRSKKKVTGIKYKHRRLNDRKNSLITSRNMQSDRILQKCTTAVFYNFHVCPFLTTLQYGVNFWQYVVCLQPFIAVVLSIYIIIESIKTISCIIKKPIWNNTSSLQNLGLDFPL